ncbi:hypothetical protein KKP90_05905 [Methanothermococcus sp. SCGC AD-155-E23]|nr:hypothetical protein [Methanothermococcus sp. SCGC AD-155-E23]
MKKIYWLLALLVVLSVEEVLASENVSLEIKMPKKVEVGEDFTIDVYVRLKGNISGLECKIHTPVYGVNHIKFINVTENREIKERAGEFYILELENNSLFLTFALFDKPLNSTFHLLRVKGKALKEGIIPIRFEATVSDEKGNANKLSPITYNLVIGDIRKSEEERGERGIPPEVEEKGKKKNNNILSWIIEVIWSFLRKIFGG